MNEVATLGNQIRDRLINQGIETPIYRQLGKLPLNPKAIAVHMEAIMLELDLDLNDDSLKDTPKRVAKMYCEEIFGGLNYDNFPKCTTILNAMNYDEMITVKCQVKSMCEHHFVPFIGTAYIAYIPRLKILGLSKFNRVTDFFSRRPQVQERLTAQIHCALDYILETNDIAIVIKAVHYCVHLRGVQDTTSTTTTSKMSGKFLTVPEARSEFLALTRTTNGDTK